VLTHLLYDTASIEAQRHVNGVQNGTSPVATPEADPAERYATLPGCDKVAIIAYLCDLAITSRPIHHFMDNCETRLTELRKEKVEINKEKKRLYVALV